MEGLLIMVALGVGILALIYRVTAGDRARRVDAAWQAAARRLNGRYFPANTDGPCRRIECTVDGIAVRIDHLTQNVGHDDITRTRLVAEARIAPEHRLRLYRAGRFEWLARVVGVEDVPVGDPAFDDEYIVQASDVELAHLWINEAVRERLVRAPDYVFTIKKARARASRDALEDDAATLVAAAEALAALCDGRQRVLAAWRRVAGEHGGQVQPVPSRWARLTAVVAGVPLTVDTRDMAGSQFTIVTAERTVRGGPAFVLAREAHLYGSELPMVEKHDGVPAGYTLWTLDPRGALAQLDGEERFLLDDVAPAKLRVDADKVIISLYGVIIDAALLSRAMTLASRVAGGATSVSDREDPEREVASAAS